MDSLIEAVRSAHAVEMVDVVFHIAVFVVEGLVKNEVLLQISFPFKRHSGSQLVILTSSGIVSALEEQILCAVDKVNCRLVVLRPEFKAKASVRLDDDCLAFLPQS